MKRQAGAPEASNAGFLGFDWMNGAAMDAMMRANEASSQAYQEWQRELVRFITSRIQITCQNWADAARLHQDWAPSAAQEFAKEANTLFQIASKIGTDLTTTLGRPNSAAAD